MAKHDAPIRPAITARTLRAKMEARFAYLYDQDKYNGQYAGEFNVLESVLADSFMDDESSREGEQSVENFAALTAARGGEKPGGGVGGSRPVAGSPRLLTGGYPSTEPPITPPLCPVDAPEFSHGGYDGGIMAGFDGTWNPLRFSYLIKELDDAKTSAGNIDDGHQVFPLEIGGEQVLVTS